MDELIKWKLNKNTCFGVMYGSNGVGKSYLAYEYAKNYFKQFIYLDARKNRYEIDTLLSISDEEELSKLYQSTETLTEEYTQEVINLEEVWTGDTFGQEREPVQKKELFLVLDHMELGVSLIHKLEIFLPLIRNDERIRLLIISNEIIEFPFGPEEYMVFPLFPLDFEEYLLALGYEWYVNSIKMHYESNVKLPEIVHKELLTIFDQYMEVGGMPLAVNELLNTHATFNISSQHALLEQSYLHKVRQQQESEGLKILQVYEVIPNNLYKTNKKFQFNKIRKGATYGFYSNAISYINHTFKGFSCMKLTQEEIGSINRGQSYLEDLITHKDKDYRNIKLYHYDIGVLHTMLQQIEVNEVMETDSTGVEESVLDAVGMDIQQETTISVSKKKNKRDIKCDEEDRKRRSIFENYVAIQLVNNGYPLYFWESNSVAKMEFVIKKDNKLVPVEVRSNDKTRSKNFSVYKTQFSTAKEQIKISTKNFEYSNRVKYIPIYAIFCI